MNEILRTFRRGHITYGEAQEMLEEEHSGEDLVWLIKQLDELLEEAHVDLRAIETAIKTRKAR